MKEEKQKIESVRNLLQEKIYSLEAAVSSRDAEIRRLHANFDQGDNVDKITNEYTDKTKQDKIDFLNGQVDFLNKQNFDLENTVKELTSKVQRSSGLFGDPCPGTPKYLQLLYTCRDAGEASTPSPLLPPWMVASLTLSS